MQFAYIAIIKENYEKAFKCFYSMGNKATWLRDETKGWYYLLNAYYEIIDEEVADHLLYARILKTLVWESRRILSNYEIMKKHLSEAKNQFEIGFVKILSDEIEVIKIVDEEKQGL